MNAEPFPPTDANEESAARRTALALGQPPGGTLHEGEGGAADSAGSADDTAAVTRQLGALLQQAAAEEPVAPSQDLRAAVEARLANNARPTIMRTEWIRSQWKEHPQWLALAASLLLAVGAALLWMAVSRTVDRAKLALESEIDTAVSDSGAQSLPDQSPGTGPIQEQKLRMAVPVPPVAKPVPPVEPSGPATTPPSEGPPLPPAVKPKTVAGQSPPSEPQAPAATAGSEAKTPPVRPWRPSSVMLNVPSPLELPGPGVKPVPKGEEHFISTARQAFAPVPIDFDRGGYQTVRAAILANRRPPSADVAIEDLLNAFAYHFAPPAGEELLAVSLEAAQCPWNEGHRLLLVGIQARADLENVVAKDVRAQIEFQRGEVLAWRLIGYESRHDPGKLQPVQRPGLPAGQSIAVLYELLPWDHGKPSKPKPGHDKPSPRREMLTLTLEYRGARGIVSRTLGFKDEGKTFAAASSDFQFAAGVASFAMLLRNSPFRGNASWETAQRIVQANLGDDPRGERAELLELIRRASRLPPRG